MIWKKTRAIVIPAIALALGASNGARAANLVTNGGFETTTNGANLQFDSTTTASYLTVASGWTSVGVDTNQLAYNFIFASGAADTTGATGQYGNVQLWGSNNGGSVVLPASSPDGGNYLAADAPYHTGAISQMINGLVVGQTYQVGFWWATAQQYGFDGDTTEQWNVSFGSQTQSTAILTTPSHGFNDWRYQTFNYTADNTSMLLSFLASGTPNGVPPFTLLDGVSVNAVPEPSALLLMGGGMLGLGVAGVRRRRQSAGV